MPSDRRSAPLKSPHPAQRRAIPARLPPRTAVGFLIAVHDLLSILPATNERGVGVNNLTSLVVGYAIENARFSAAMIVAGPALRWATR